MENLFCCSTGFIDFSIAVNKGCFVPGETVHVDGTIVNRTHENNLRLTIAFVQDLELCTSSTYDANIRETTHILKTLIEITRPPIERDHEDRLNDVTFVVPSVPASRMDGSKLFNITYHLKIATSDYCSSSSSICREIVIGDLGFPSDFQPYVITHQPQAFSTSHLSTPTSGCPQSKNVDPAVSGFTMNDFQSRNVEFSDVAEVHTTLFMMPETMDFSNPGYDVRAEFCVPAHNTDAGICGNREQLGMDE